MDPDPTADPSVQCYRLLKKVKIFLLFLLLCSFTILLNTKKMYKKNNKKFKTLQFFLVYTKSCVMVPVFNNFSKIQKCIVIGSRSIRSNNVYT